MTRAIPSLIIPFVLTTLALPCWAADEETEDDKVIRLEKIVAAMQYNHAAADAHYVGKELQVRGIASRIQRYRPDKDADPQYIVLLKVEAPPGTSEGLPVVNFIFPAKELQGLADIGHGSAVLIRGTCRESEGSGSGDVLQLRFDDCRLIRIYERPDVPDPTDAPRADLPGHPTGPRSVPAPFPGIPMRAIPRPM